MQVRSLGRDDPLEKEMANPLQNCCLENSMDRGAWQATVHGVAKSQIRLSDYAHSSLLTIFIGCGLFSSLVHGNYLFSLDRSPLLVTFAICIHVSICVEMSSLYLWFTFSLLMGLLFNRISYF